MATSVATSLGGGVTTSLTGYSNGTVTSTTEASKSKTKTTSATTSPTTTAPLQVSGAGAEVKRKEWGLGSLVLLGFGAVIGML